MAEEYWEERARKEYLYKNEKFYTITAIPYYVERRKIILNYLVKYVQSAKKIVDIGCGDGEYLYLLNKASKEYCGVDKSKEMLALAKKRCVAFENISFECSDDGSHRFTNFDMAYIVAVLAHIDDASMNQILKKHMNKCLMGEYCAYVSRLRLMR